MEPSSSDFGCFSSGDEGLPVYQYQGPTHSRVPANSCIPDVPFFLLGNHRLLAFIRVDGGLRWLSGERSWMQLTEPASEPAGRVLIGESTFSLTGEDSFCSTANQRTFGVGFACFENEVDGVNLTRQLCTPPARKCGDADPALLLRWKGHNRTSRPQQLIVEERFRISPRMLGHRYLPTEDLPVIYTPAFQTCATGGRLLFIAQTRDPHHQVERGMSCAVDLHPPAFHVHSREGSTWTFEWENGTLVVRLKRTLNAGESFEDPILLSLEFDESLPDQTIADLLEASRERDIPFRSEWRRRIPVYSDEKDPEFQLELQWHSYILDAMATRHELSGETYIPQGTAYDFAAGTNAAPRDHLQHMLGVLHSDPALAKSCLRFVMNKMTPAGEILYTEVDVGRLSNQMWHTSDQALYLFRSVAAYLQQTADKEFLDERCGYAPYGFGTSGSVRQHLETAFVYLRDEIGLGLNGLPKLLNSDWNDAIFYGRPIREHFFCASSVANAGMAVTALGEFLEVMDHLDAWNGNTDWRTSIATFRAKVEEAWLRDLGARDFARRAHLGDKTILGDTKVYLEPQPWLLMSPELETERKQRIIEKIESSLGEPKGPFLRQMESPDLEDTVFEVGEGENAACWYALTGEWILALSSVNRQKARSTWESISFKAYREAYPSQWIGQWTAPDTLNSSLSSQPGWVNRNFHELVTMPVFCAHQHAWVLYTWNVMQKENENA